MGQVRAQEQCCCSGSPRMFRRRNCRLSASTPAGSSQNSQTKLASAGTIPDGTKVCHYHLYPEYTRGHYYFLISDGNLEDLPGQFAVWAASEEAKFLHGRFVWAKWDVNELREGKLREMIDNEPEFLQVTVKGL